MSIYLGKLQEHPKSATPSLYYIIQAEWTDHILGLQLQRLVVFEISMSSVVPK